MSRYRPAISIRTDLADPSALAPSGVPAYDALVSRVEKYSITPRTLKSVTEFDSAYVTTSTVGVASAAGTGSSYKPELYTSIEEYSYAGNTVLRYAIRTDLITPDATSGAIFGEGTTVPKASSVSTAAYTPAMARSAVLHGLEKYTIKNAIECLISSASSTAVVDIFERKDGAAVKIGSDGHPIVHSVVLHFIPSNGIIGVVDPSNFSFSRHLANDDFNAELSTLASPLPQIVTITTGKFQIYTPMVKPEGSAFDQFRDCTDVAVKIAFSLQKNPLVTFDEPSIKIHPAIIAISNNQTIDKSIDNVVLIDKIPARIKQDSSVVCQEAFSRAQKAYNSKLKILVQIGDSATLTTAEIEYKRILTTPANDFVMLHALERLDLSLNDAIATHIATEHSLLVGNIHTFLSETP